MRNPDHSGNLTPSQSPPGATRPAKASGGADKAGARVSRRLSLKLIGLGTTAILSAYAAGYARTQSAEDHILALEQQARAPAPRPASSTPGATDAPGAALAPSPTLSPTAEPATATAAPTTVDPVAPTAPSSPATATAAPAVRTAMAPPTTSPRPAAPTAPATSARAASVVTPATPTPVPTPPPTRAPARPTATATPNPTAVASKYRDGTYVGTGTSRHGDVTVTVVIQGGKIASAAIADATTRYPISRIASLPPEVVATQAPPVDVVSRATDSSLAYIGAVNDALSKAA